MEKWFATFGKKGLQKTIQGIAYQESQSVLYPMLMHSLANVLMVGTGYLFILLS